MNYGDGEAMPTGREKPGEHWNARIIREQNEIRNAAPAGDGGLRDASAEPKLSNPDGLREALEKLADTYADVHGGNPSAPGSRERVYFGVEIDLRTALENHPAAPAGLQPADERPLRAALERYFSNGGPDTPIRTTWHEGVEHWEAPAEDIRELIDGSAVPQPVDRQAIARAIHDVDEKHPWLSEYCIDSECGKSYDRYAAAVLAVLAGEQEKVEP